MPNRLGKEIRLLSSKDFYRISIGGTNGDEINNRCLLGMEFRMLYVFI